MIKFYLRFVIKLISDLFPILILNRTKIIYKKKYPSKVIIKRYSRVKNIFRILGKLRFFSLIYDLVEDKYSKDLFIRLLSARAFGFPNVFVSPNTNIFWNSRDAYFEN